MPPEALYHSLARYYDRIYRWKDYAKDARQLLQVVRRVTGRRPRSLLDVGCGTGKHLAEFRRRIPEIAGVDRSPEMLREARRRLGPRVPLVRADMRHFDLDRRFDVVVCLFSAIGYLTRHSDRDRTLRTFFRHLEPGGVALVEGWVRPAAWRGDSIDLVTYDGAEAKIARLSRSNRQGRRTTVTMHYLVGEPRGPIRHVVETHRQALLEPEELLGSFRRAGFRARVLLGGPYHDRGLYVGVRPGEDLRVPQGRSNGAGPGQAGRRSSSAG